MAKTLFIKISNAGTQAEASNLATLSPAVWVGS